MKTQTQTLYIHQPPFEGGKYGITVDDMSQFGWVLLGTQTVEVTIPDTDPVEAELKSIAREKDAMKAEFSQKISRLQRRENELRALEHNDGE